MRWNVPPIGQTNPVMCWEAVAHMMWLFRYPGDETGYRKKAKPYLDYAKKSDQGLDLNNTDTFYRTLGMLVNRDANQLFIRHSIYLGPLAIIIGLGTNSVHAEVLVGVDGSNYIFINPQETANLAFDPDTIIAGKDSSSAPVVPTRSTRIDPPQLPGDVKQPVALFSSRWVWWWSHKHQNHQEMLR